MSVSRAEERMLEVFLVPEETIPRVCTEELERRLSLVNHGVTANISDNFPAVHKLGEGS